MSYRDGIVLIKDGLQALFFLVVGVVTILTYLKAKKTLLQPIRTEIFKEQLRLFSDLLTMFGGKTELELREDFAFEKLFYANAALMFDQYARIFFGVDIDEKARPYGPDCCPVTRMPGHLLVLADTHVLAASPDYSPPEPAPETKAAIWARYKFEVIKLPHEFCEKEHELERFISSPLIPKKLGNLLKAYKSVVEKNIQTLEKVFSGSAQEMPEKYPNREVLKKASLIWLHNRYNAEYSNLETSAQRITEFVRAYFGIESLME